MSWRTFTQKSIEINANIVPVAVEVDVTFKQQEYGADGWQRVQHQHRSRKRRESKVSTSSSSSSSSSSTSIQESSSNSTLCELATLLCASSSTICGSAASLRGSSSTSSTSSHGSESCYTISRNSRCTNVPKMRVSKLAPVTNPWSSKRRQSTESTRNNQQYEPLDNTGCQEVRHQRSRKTTSTSPMVRDPVHHVNIEQIPLQRANMHCQQPHGIRLGSKSKLPQSFASIVTSRPPDPVKCRQYARNVVPLPRDASYAAIVGNVSR